MIPAVLRQNALTVWGADGAAWLERLPALLESVAADWQLVVGDPFGLTFHWVCAVTREDGSPAVLKLGVPHRGHLTVEAAALRAYGGAGAVRLFALDPDRGALLLERADPGTPASALVPHDDETATAAAISVIRRLHQPVPADCGLPDVADQAADFANHLRTYLTDDPLPRRLVQRAAALFDELTASAPRIVTLHGDLHHDNILRGSREPWLAIDPHGAVGDPGNDVGAWAYNPDPDNKDPALLRLVPARIEQLADGLGMPLDRVVAYAFVKAVLSEVWTVEDGGPPRTRALDVARFLEPQLR